jgi:anti-sigma factor RsiW
MICCWLARRTLIPYQDGELEPGRARKLEDHVRRCPRCRRELQQFREVNLLLRTLSVCSRSERYWPQAVQQLRGKLQGLPPAHVQSQLSRAGWLVEGLPRTLLPMTLVGAALINSLGVLGLEEEAWSFLSLYILPLVLD